MTDSTANHAELIQRNRELSILNAIAEALNREVNLDRALRTTLSLVADLCQLRTAWIWLIDEATNDPYLAATLHLPPALTEDPLIMDGREYCWCLKSYQDGIMEGAANIKIITCTRLDGRVDAAGGLRTHASIPLYAQEKKLGVLNVASPDWSKLSKDELRLLHTVGDLLSIAIERARLFERSAQFGAMEERNRIAREIHDTLAQGLTAITLRLETADAVLEDQTNSDHARKLILDALNLTRQNLDAARRSVLDLRAAPLEGRTLAEAISQLLSEQFAAYTVQFESNENRPLPHRIELGLYRVVQESLNNIEKHAQAAHITVNLQTSPDHIHLSISDDGTGFDVACVQNTRFGLAGMNERVRLLGGQLTICSSPAEGTMLTVDVPLGETP